MKFRRRLYKVLEEGPIGDRASGFINRSIIGLIVVNLIAVILQSIPELASEYITLFATIEIVTLAVLTIEYGLRVWVAVEHASYRHLRH